MGIRFCEFVDCTFEEDVTFPILDLTSNIGLIDLMKNNEQEITISLGTKGETDLKSALEQTSKLLPFYYETKQFYQVINILVLDQYSIDIIVNIINEALNYVVNNNDFPSLLGLCNLIVRLKIFENNPDKLKIIFKRIINIVDPNILPYHLQKSYLTYINNIQTILVDNPEHNPVAKIIFYTDIETEYKNDLFSIFKDIEKVIYDIIPDCTPVITITRYCPYEIIATIAAQLPFLLQVCQTFYYTFGGIKSLKDIMNSRHEKTSNEQSDITKESFSEISTDNRLSYIDTTTKESITINLGIIKYRKETLKRVKTVEYLIG